MVLKAIQEAHDAIFNIYEYLQHKQAAEEELSPEVDEALFQLKEACNELIDILD